MLGSAEVYSVWCVIHVPHVCVCVCVRAHTHWPLWDAMLLQGWWPESRFEPGAFRELLGHPEVFGRWLGASVQGSGDALVCFGAGGSLSPGGLCDPHPRPTMQPLHHTRAGLRNPRNMALGLRSGQQRLGSLALLLTQGVMATPRGHKRLPPTAA